MKRICKQCGAEFELSQDEVAFYKSRNLNLPKRCKKCRAENKQGKKPAAKNGQGFKARQDERNNDSMKQQDIQERQSEFSDSINYSEGTQKQEPAKEPCQDKKVRKKFWLAAAVLILLAVIKLFLPGGKQDVPDVEAETKTEVNAGGADERAGDAGVYSEDYSEKAGNADGKDTTDGEDAPDEIEETVELSADKEYVFRKEEYLQQHFQKHGAEFGYATAEEYLAGANRVINSPDVLHKLEEEDGDDVYYLEESNEFVIVSTDGYLRTYFKPADGVAYYNRQ